MLATVQQFRGRGIATKLVCMAIDAMKERDADEVSSDIPIKHYLSAHSGLDSLGDGSHKYSFFAPL
jgi:hypothetical protein